MNGERTDDPDQPLPAAGPTPRELADARPETDDDEQWATEALDARHKSLATVRAAADAWGKSITAILGGFALVAFIKGPEAIKDVPTGPKAAFTIPGIGPIDPARTVILLIFVAAALVIIAIVAAALAAQGTPGWTRVLDGPVFKSKSASSTKDAIGLLWISRILTLVGAAVVFGALALAWMSTIDKLNAGTPKTQAAIVSTATAVVCGELRSRPDGSIEVVPESGAASVVAPLTAVTLVDSCPAIP